jgi:uncharacterized protein (DUF58 family)
VPALPFEFNGVVRFTRVGMGYLTFTMVLGFAALNTGNNALYIGLAFMLGTLLFSGVASKGGLKNTEVRIEHIGEAWAGERVFCSMVVRNRSRIWNVRDLVITSPHFRRPVLVADLPRRAEVTVGVDLIFERRGIARLSSLDLYTRYPFNIFLKRRALRVKSETIVYPQLLERSEMAAVVAAMEGEETPIERMGPGVDIFGFREYVRGDSLRQLHWKKSASLGRWIIKQPQSDAGRTIAIVVDPVMPRSATEPQFERMISAATTLVHEALEQGMEVWLFAGAVELHATPTGNAGELYEELALIAPQRERLFLNVPRRAVVFSLQKEQADET